MKKAFTLIELLVVVLIIGILSAIALPQYQKAVMKARYVELKILTRAIADAQERYYLANNNYTTNFSDLDIDIPGIPVENVTNRISLSNADCIIDTDAAACIQTKPSDVVLEYEIFYHYGANYPQYRGKLVCVAGTDSSSLEYKLCQGETGLTSPSWDGLYTYWVY